MRQFLLLLLCVSCVSGYQVCGINVNFTKLTWTVAGEYLGYVCGTGVPCYFPNTTYPTLTSRLNKAFEEYYITYAPNQGAKACGWSGVAGLYEHGDQPLINLKCVCKPFMSATAMAQAIKFACSYIDCSKIPQTPILARCDAAVHLYYSSVWEKQGPSGCDFAGVAGIRRTVDHELNPKWCPNSNEKPCASTTASGYSCCTTGCSTGPTGGCKP
eukprot:TRINITY_DN56539_c0_g2_i1.p2 TRINITY_DN56539_c0_g2~~TRINITY_DN56539_c0_g2_i1.p2  ORF type:complete len:214 (-),score=19.68 TRINITY_DN56539_c0_g2_i1:818-1459(-)